MPTRDARLSLLTFPQSWDGTSLKVRFLCLPKGDPQQPLTAASPAFDVASLVFSAQLISGFAQLPTRSAATTVAPLQLDASPADKAALFAELTNHFEIDRAAPPVVVPAAASRFHKVVTPSYTERAGSLRRSAFLREPNEYACALHEAHADQPAVPEKLSSALPWGRLLSFVLRQPKLAEALGLMGEATVTPPDPSFFEKGGWLFLDLDAASDYAGVAGLVTCYAARVPPLTTSRALFAAVLFPVLEPLQAATAVVADGVFREAEVYDDGLAKQVHGAQTSEAGDAIQLAWDDEQLAIWLNRQADRDATGELKVDRLCGVAGYRVDVRAAGDAQWHSLERIESQADLTLGPHTLGAFRGEGVVEAIATQPSAKRGGVFWLPAYFATWRGASLVLGDQQLVALHARPELQLPGAPPHRLDREKSFVPVADTEVPLRYGQRYEFRVRLADLTRGGPDWLVSSEPAAAIDFKRRTRPGPIAIVQPPAAGKPSVTITRPRLGYPEALFTGRATFADIEQDLLSSAALPASQRTAAGVYDPDVLSVAIRVEVKALAGDTAAYFTLYETSRVFEVDDLTLPLAFEDHAQLSSLSDAQPDDGPLVLPSARDVRLTFSAQGRSDPGYFFDAAASSGEPSYLEVRSEAATEPELLAELPLPATTLQAFFFQPLFDDKSAPPEQRLAAELGLDQNQLTLSSKPGRRAVFACSAGLRHTLAPERSSLTLGSSADLVQRWINVVHVSLARDWTWDGLDRGIEVVRSVRRQEGPAVEERVGTIDMPRALCPAAVRGVAADVRDGARQSCELWFFDAFDPKPKTGEHPSELTIEYSLRPAYRAAPAPAPLSCSVLVPMTTPPAQLPRIVSAGIALSPYAHAADYSQTEARQRVLWFELAEAPRDPQDAYFVRVLASGPDPLLLNLSETPIAESIEPELPIDPESMRRITPGQPRDASGSEAMRGLQATPLTATHFSVPLPDDLSESSPELFGMFVYEVRVGHTTARWSTAQARFGAPLRVAGVQHPAPALSCQVARAADRIAVRAAFATPVHQGRNLRPRSPNSQLWSLLYARVRQLDRSEFRNVLLAQTRLLRAEHEPVENARELFGEGTFAIDDVHAKLARLGLPPDAPLTLLAAEVFGEPFQAEPLGAGLGHARILRVSPLAPVPDAC